MKRTMTTTQYAAVILAFIAGISSVAAILVWNAAKEPPPSLWFDKENNTWRTDGSLEMVQRATEAAHVGEVIHIASGSRTYGPVEFTYSKPR